MVRMSLMIHQTGQIQICFRNMFQLNPNWNIYCMSMRWGMTVDCTNVRGWLLYTFYLIKTVPFFYNDTLGIYLYEN